MAGNLAFFFFYQRSSPKYMSDDSLIKNSKGGVCRPAEEIAGIFFFGCMKLINLMR